MNAYTFEYMHVFTGRDMSVNKCMYLCAFSFLFKGVATPRVAPAVHILPNRASNTNTLIRALFLALVTLQGTHSRHAWQTHASIAGDNGSRLGWICSDCFAKDGKRLFVLPFVFFHFILNKSCTAEFPFHNTFIL